MSGGVGGGSREAPPYPLGVTGKRVGIWHKELRSKVLRRTVVMDDNVFVGWAGIG
jgi:hypothetical protein